MDYNPKAFVSEQRRHDKLLLDKNFLRELKGGCHFTTTSITLVYAPLYIDHKDYSPNPL